MCVGYCTVRHVLSHCIIAVCFIFLALYCVLINCFVSFNLFVLCLFSCLYVLPSFCFCIVLFIVSSYVNSCLFSICVQFTDYCQLVENQLHSVNIISYIASYNRHGGVLHVFGNNAFTFMLDMLNI